jgi:hypothetical protein
MVHSDGNDKYFDLLHSDMRKHASNPACRHEHDASILAPCRPRAATRAGLRRSLQLRAVLPWSRLKIFHSFTTEYEVGLRAPCIYQHVSPVHHTEQRTRLLQNRVVEAFELKHISTLLALSSRKMCKKHHQTVQWARMILTNRSRISPWEDLV